MSYINDIETERSETLLMVLEQVIQNLEFYLTAETWMADAYMEEAKNWLVLA